MGGGDSRRTGLASVGEEEQEEEYEVEKILDKKPGVKGKMLYSVKWVGWADPTWEEEENLTGCEEKLAEFESALKEKKKKEKEKRKSVKEQNTPVESKKKRHSTAAPVSDNTDLRTAASDLPPEKEAETILGATDSPQLAFLVKFKSGKNALVEKKVCRDKYPRLLCDFLLERVQE